MLRLARPLRVSSDAASRDAALCLLDTGPMPARQTDYAHSMPGPPAAP
ncbi:hypothetical protein SAMN06296028_10271 [Kocuria indica]|uniref:Uncharacterized protein n=1 Tax=Kocuria marina subsp. indica TaxID=1049583 RepID=A0A1X7CB26_9MICC|nr:hypothetical protein SAMN06296028_10271 [Kocuria indica]